MDVVWGYESKTVVDTVFRKFCKYLLGLKSSTPNCMVHGDLGSYPVSLTITVRLQIFLAYTVYNDCVCILYICHVFVYFLNE